MEKLVFRKFIFDVLIFFLVLSTSLTLIVWVIQAVNYLDFVSEDGHSFFVYFRYISLILPKIFGKLILFTFYISIFYVLVNYEESNEILIYWSNGISKFQFINLILRFSFIVMIFHVLFNFFVVPKTQDMARSIIRSSAIDYFPSLIKSKQFIDTVEDLTIFVEEKNENGVFNNIYLKDNLEDDKSQIISARTGKIITKNNNNYLLLEEGRIINIDGNKTTSFNFGKTEFDLSKYSTKTTTYPKLQEINSFVLIKCLKSFYLFNTGFKEPFFSCDNGSISPVLRELFKRTLYQFYLLMVALIAGCLLVKTKNDRNYTYYKFILFLFGMFFIILSEFNIQYIDFYSNLKLLLVCLPIILVLIFYVLLILNRKIIFR